MARRHRFHSPTATYHVMLRGNDGQPIFFSERDKTKMCLLIQQGVERFRHNIEAFCFMSNHIHLAIRVADISISRIMQHLAFRYTQYINRRYKRIGHLFQGRFKSILVDDEEYLKELVRYIHLNPVRARLVSDPRQYIWSSYRAYMKLDEYSWLNKNRILEKFSSNEEQSIKICEEYTLQGIGIETKFDFKSGSNEGMLGNDEFIDKILISVDVVPPRKIELTVLVAKICELHCLTQEQLCMPGKHPKHSQARALLAFFVREIDNLSLTGLGKLLKRDPSGLTALANRLESKISEDPLISNYVNQVREWLEEPFRERISESPA